MKRPKVTKRPAMMFPDRTLIEVTFPSGKGCLISVDETEVGGALIRIYRADEGVKVSGPFGNLGEPLGSLAEPLER